MAEMGCQVLLYNPLLANHTHPNIEILPTLPFYIYEHAIVSFPSNSYYDASTTQFCILQVNDRSILYLNIALEGFGSMFKLIANAEIEQIRIEVRESTDQKLAEIYENIKEMAKFGFQVVNYSP